MKNYAIIGVCGYVAPKHLQAIKDTGGNLVAAMDLTDAAGLLDSFFPEASFFTEMERFDRHLEKLKRQGTHIDYMVICSPNHLHDAHIRFALRHGMDVICEKPVVLNPWNLEALESIETETGHKVHTIFQLRLHEGIRALRDRVSKDKSDHIYDIDLTYITSRGLWYYASWKGNIEKSGGIATNIGIHFFDMLHWIFGTPTAQVVHVHTHDRASGLLKYNKARVRWFLSISADTLPSEAVEQGQKTYRSMRIDDEFIDFSSGFDHLHTRSYEAIHQGKGILLADCKPATATVHHIRNAEPVGLHGDHHERAELPISPHPFS